MMSLSLETFEFNKPSGFGKLVVQFGARFADIENWILAFTLAAMVVLPIAEIALRALLEIGIENVNALVQHLTLVVGTLGAAVAARENRLLAFAGTKLLQGRMARIARVSSCTVSVAICILLCYGSLLFIEVERTGGLVLAYGLPLWMVELVIPVAFCFIAVRLLQHTTKSPLGMIASVLVSITIIVVTIFAPFSDSVIRTIALAVLLVAAVFGTPVFVVVGGAALILLWTEGIPVASLAIDQYSLVSNPSLPAIPLFTLTGYFLAESKAPQRLVELFDACFGRIRGGPVLATVLACTFFTCFTGASGVTILALGGLVLPLMITAGYHKRTALGLVTGGGSAGVLLLPALPLILYAIIANISIEEMFLGGLLPAILMLSIAVFWGIRQQPVNKTIAGTSFDTKRAVHAIWDAKWELLIPVVLLMGMFSGLMTLLEAAAVTAFYAFIVEVFIHNDLSLHADVPRVLVNCGLIIGGILLILGVALGLTNYMVDAQISDLAVEWVTRSIKSPWTFLLALNGFLLIIGFFIDIFSAIVVVAPLIVPMGLAFGIHPVHLGIIFLANMELGYLTPPVGMNLFFAAIRFERPMLEICRAVAPLFIFLAVGVLIITYVPWLSTGLLFLIH